MPCSSKRGSFQGQRKADRQTDRQRVRDLEGARPTSTHRVSSGAVYPRALVFQFAPAGLHCCPATHGPHCVFRIMLWRARAARPKLEKDTRGILEALRRRKRHRSMCDGGNPLLSLRLALCLFLSISVSFALGAKRRTSRHQRWDARKARANQTWKCGQTCLRRTKRTPLRPRKKYSESFEQGPAASSKVCEVVELSTPPED